METYMVASALVHPMGVFILVAVVTLSSFALSRASAAPRFLSLRHLSFGYLSIVLACVLIAAAVSYVSPEESSTKWHVPTDEYWSVLIREFAVTAVVLTYVALLGVALVGAPLILGLSRLGLATVPVVLVISVVISLAASVFLAQFARPYATLDEQVHDFVRDAPVLVTLHLVLAFAFCLGARIPWVVEHRTRREGT